MLALYLDTSALIVARNESVLETLTTKEVEVRLTHVQIDENMQRHLAFREYGEILEFVKKKFEERGIRVKIFPSIAVLGFSRVGFCILTDKQVKGIYEKVVREMFEKDEKSRRELVKYLGVERFKGLIENLPRVDLKQIPGEALKIICHMIRDAIILTSSYIDSSKNEGNYSYVFIIGDKLLSKIAEAIIREHGSRLRVKCPKRTEPSSMINIVRQLT